jgi:oxygen-dependent protoporphyrinogen oxidase
VTSVHLGVRLQDVEGDLRGFGLLSPGRPVLGTLMPSSLWPARAPEGHVLLTTLTGGARHPEVAALPDDDLVALVREELALTVKLKPTARPALVRVVRWPQAVPQYELGHRARVAAIEELTARHPGLALTGAWYRGVSVLDCLRDGKVQAERLSSAG